MAAFAYIYTMVAIVGLLFLVGAGGFYLKKQKAPPLRVQLAWMVFWSIFSLRYWFMSASDAGAIFVAIYDPIYHAFPGAMESDFIPCSPNHPNCSALGNEGYDEHLGWSVRLHDNPHDPWVMKLLMLHILGNTVCLTLMPIQLYLIAKGKRSAHRMLGRVALIGGMGGTSMSFTISMFTHGDVKEYGGSWSIMAFASMWAGVFIPGLLGYLAIKRKDVASHTRWMVRMFGALFGSFFFWRFEALVLGWLFRSSTGWVFYTVSSWILGMALFDGVATRSGYYEPIGHGEKKET